MSWRGPCSNGASWRVLYAENGRDALAQMRVHAVDLVLTDVVMPELDGLASSSTRRKTTPSFLWC